MASSWLWWLAQLLLLLLAVYHGAKLLVVAFAGPLLAPFGVTFQAISLRSGISGLEYTPHTARKTRHRDDLDSLGNSSEARPSLTKLGIRQVSLSFLLSERKVAVTFSGVHIRVRWPSNVAHQQSEPKSVEMFQRTFETIIGRILNVLKNARRIVRIISWIGMIEIHVEGADFASVSGDEQASNLYLRDETAWLSLRTDILKDDGHAFAIFVKLSPVSLHSSDEVIASFEAPSELNVKVNVQTGLVWVKLSLPSIVISPVGAISQAIKNLQWPRKPKLKAFNISILDILETEYSKRKDFYVSLLRNSFLSSIHSFKPTISVRIAKLTAQISRLPITGFDEFDLDIPATVFVCENVNVELSMTSENSDLSQRILWLNLGVITGSCSVDTELHSGHQTCIFSLPAFSVSANVSIPLLSLTQSSVGEFNFTSNALNLNVILPSRIFILFTLMNSQQKMMREKSSKSVQKIHFWGRIFRRYYKPAVNISLVSPMVGFRFGSHTGLEDYRDEIFLLSSDKINILSDDTLQLTPTTDSFSNVSDFKFLDMQIFMAAVRLDAISTVKPNRTIFETLKESEMKQQLFFMSDSRSVATVTLTETGINIDCKSVLAHFAANLTNLSPQQPGKPNNRPHSSSTNRSAGSSNSTTHIPNTFDFFAIATAIAGLIHKVGLIKSACSRNVGDSNGAVSLPLTMSFELKTPSAVAICSEGLICAMVATVTDAVVRLVIDPNLNQTVIVDAREMQIDAGATLTLANKNDKENLPNGVIPQLKTRECVARAYSPCNLTYHKILVPTANKTVGASVAVNLPIMDLKLTLWKFFACFTSYLPILKMTKIINAREGGDPVVVDVAVSVGLLNMFFTFSNGSQLEARLSEVDGTFEKLRVGKGRVKHVRLRTPDKRGEWNEVLSIGGFGGTKVHFEKLTNDDTVIAVDAEEAVITNPFGFEFSDLFEDIINTQKAVKNLIFQRLGLVSMARLSTIGKTVFQRKEMPEYRVHLKKIVFRILDDEFESKLGRNYKASFEEQFGRLARDAEFQKKGMAMRDANGGEITTQIEEAYWLIQEYNSRNWIRKLASFHNDFPPLLTATIFNISVVVKPPSLPCKYIEQSINFIDSGTPVAIEYDDLIARDVAVSFSEFIMQLRDFQNPLVCVPAASEAETWKTEGLLIIADLLATSESKRSVDLSLSPLDLPDIIVYRNLCPVKIYAQSNTQIRVTEKLPLLVAWGMCVEPPLADMIRVLDTFTKASVDPSPPVGWWDKMRHMVHLGKTTFRIEGGDLKIRILGSYTPNYDARFNYGTGAVDISFGKGVTVELRNGGSENVIINSGQCTFSIPNSEHETGRIAGAHRVSVKDEIIAQFVGGVRIAAGIRFTIFRDGNEVDVWKSHSDVVLKLPQYAEPEYDDVVDSYFGFRSTRIHVVYDIQSPSNEFSSDTKEDALNFVSFTDESFNRFLALIPIFQSPLAVIPIRRGRLFEAKVTPIDKPKLGRSIKSNHLKGTIYPLILSYICEFEDVTGGVGLRFGAKRMDFDLVFNQINVTMFKEGRDEPTNIFRWVLDAAQVEFNEVEGRMISFGTERSSAGNRYCASAHGGNNSKVNNGRWFLGIDYNYVAKQSAIDMIPFVWSPKVKYYKRNADSKFESEHKFHTESEVRNDQIELYQKRSDELEQDIRQYINIQKSLADKKELFGYESVQSEIDLITAKLEVLFEKKNTIERHIRASVKHIREYEKGGEDKEQSVRIGGAKDSMFDHHYGEAKHQDVAERSSQWFIIFDSYGSKMKQRKKPPMDAGIAATAAFEEVYEKSNGQDLLQALLADLDNLVVPCEQQLPAQQQNEATPRNDGISSPSTTPSSLADLIWYTPSSDPLSSDYVAANMRVNSSYIIQCINPQVNFEASPKSSGVSPASVVVVAETMQFRSVRILEAVQATTCSNMNLEEEQRQNEDLVKTRTILNVQNAQFFTCSFEDAARETSAGLSSRHELLTVNDPKNEPGKSTRYWPIWVPVENVTWTDIEIDPCLQKIVGRTSASVYRDKPNPLFVQRNSSITKADFVDSYLIDFPDFRIEVKITGHPFSNVNHPLQANSKQFFYVLDVVTNLLMYHDPSSGERTKRLRKMMLAWDQMSDLMVVLDSVKVLQEKIRQGSKLLRFGKKFRTLHVPMSRGRGRTSVIAGMAGLAAPGTVRNYASPLMEQESDDIRRMLLQYQEELYVIVECLKAQTILEQKKNSMDVALQMTIHAKNLVWTMMQTASNTGTSGSSSASSGATSSLAQWKITDSRFQWVQNEDQSSINTLEIDRLHLENLVPGSAFRNMISPFGDTRGVDFSRNKMVRVYWREMAAVAGIKVVDHFESKQMNIYPLLLQVSRDTGKSFEKYFFPKAPTADQDDEAAEAATSATGGSSVSGPHTATTNAVSGVAAIATAEKKAVASTVAAMSKQLKKAKGSGGKRKEVLDEFKEMQARAAVNRSFVYIKFPALQLCLSYKGAQKKNIEDLNMFTFLMPTLEYRNRTWTWQDLFGQLKRDAIKAVLQNSGALVRDKLLKKAVKQTSVVSENEDEQHTGGTPAPSAIVPVGASRPLASSAGATEQERVRKGYFRVVGAGGGKKKSEAHH
ncbi:hypothetical protein HDU83_002347 [Entophlyctis luteolus]|nr:hypothetical protein HDU83_002347 [Entophlyctis luteolus]